MHAADMVEGLRSTGYDGRETWIPRLPNRVGTTVVAIRQLEAVATQFVSPWLEDVLAENGLWEFLRSNLLRRAEELVGIAATASCDQPADAQAIGLLREFLTQARDGGASTGSYGEFATTFLVGVMIVRQHLEATTAADQQRGDREFRLGLTNIAPEVLATGCWDCHDREFRFGSSNVAPTYFELATKKLGRTPLGIKRGDAVADVFQSLEQRIADCGPSA